MKRYKHETKINAGLCAMTFRELSYADVEPDLVLVSPDPTYTEYHIIRGAAMCRVRGTGVAYDLNELTHPTFAVPRSAHDELRRWGAFETFSVDGDGAPVISGVRLLPVTFYPRTTGLSVFVGVSRASEFTHSVGLLRTTTSGTVEIERRENALRIDHCVIEALDLARRTNSFIGRYTCPDVVFARECVKLSRAIFIEHEMDDFGTLNITTRHLSAWIYSEPNERNGVGEFIAHLNELRAIAGGG